MNGIRKFLLPIASILLTPALVIAHHNAASHYILDQKITVKGVVSQFRLINPHARIYFDVMDSGERVNRLRKILLLIASMLLTPAMVIAHHNAASHYLVDQKIAVKGVVTQFRLINPHARIYFDVTDHDGEVQKWLGEGNASSVLRRRGW